MVNPGDDYGRQLGFSRDAFFGYMTVNEWDCYISFIEAKRPGTGDFRRLLSILARSGFTTKIPTPSNRMRSICQRHGFALTWEWCDEVGEHSEVWMRTPTMARDAETGELGGFD